ncbi:MAG: DUF2294 domain-containing protein [Patescibacteria group bacterium]
MDEKSFSKGKIEDTIAKRVIEFYVTTLGVGPKEAKIYIVRDMVIVRLKGKLLPIEEQLLNGAQGIALVKTIRKAFHELNTHKLRGMIEEVTGYKVVSSHSDVSTKTGEKFEAFILDSDLEKALYDKKN